jgi:hypothetical protein
MATATQASRTIRTKRARIGVAVHLCQLGVVSNFRASEAKGKSCISFPLVLALLRASVSDPRLVLSANRAASFAFEIAYSSPTVFGSIDDCAKTQHRSRPFVA